MNRAARPWYLFAVVIAALGIGLGVHRGVDAWNAFQDMPRLVMPGQGTVELAAGSHTVYAESGTVIDGVVYTVDTVSLRCNLVAADGTAARLASSSTRSSYSFGSIHGTSLMSAEVPTSGTYTLSCEGDAAEQVVLAFGDGIVGAIFLAAFAALAGLGAGIAIAVLGHRRARRIGVDAPAIGRL